MKSTMSHVVQAKDLSAWYVNYSKKVNANSTFTYPIQKARLVAAWSVCLNSRS